MHGPMEHAWPDTPCLDWSDVHRQESTVYSLVGTTCATEHAAYATHTAAWATDTSSACACAADSPHIPDIFPPHVAHRMGKTNIRMMTGMLGPPAPQRAGANQEGELVTQQHLAGAQSQQPPAHKPQVHRPNVQLHARNGEKGSATEIVGVAICRGSCQHGAHACSRCWCADHKDICRCGGGACPLGMHT